jgi:hypothetical protein
MDSQISIEHEKKWKVISNLNISNNSIFNFRLTVNLVLFQPMIQKKKLMVYLPKKILFDKFDIF